MEMWGAGRREDRTRITLLGSKILNSLSYLPYFKGKGLLALGIIRICGRPLTMRLPNGARIWVGNDNAGYLLLPYLIGKYEHKTTRIFLYYLRLLGPNKCVIDIGANVGYYAIMAAWHWRHRKETVVFAFEPNPWAVQRLRENVKLNGLTNIEVIAQGVTDKSGPAVLYFNPDGITLGSLRSYLPHLAQPCQISVITLDEFVEEHPNVRIGLIKLDIEGGELLAFMGGRRTIERDRPLIIYEENEPACQAFGYSPLDLRAWLKTMGYRTMLIERLEGTQPARNMLAIPEI